MQPNDRLGVAASSAASAPWVAQLLGLFPACCSHPETHAPAGRMPPDQRDAIGGEVVVADRNIGEELGSVTKPHVNIHQDPCGKLAFKHFSYTLSSALPGRHLMKEDAAAGQRPSGPSATGKIIASSRQMSRLPKQKKKKERGQINLSLNSRAL